MYRLTLNFQKRNHKQLYEVLISRRAAFALPPGGVAFALSACNSPQDVLAFMDKFRISEVRYLGRAIPAADPSAAQLLLLEKWRIEKFIVHALLVPPPPWAAGIPPSRRASSFLALGEGQKAREYLSMVKLVPAASERLSKILHTAKGKTGLFQLEEAWKQAEGKREGLFYEYSRWKTFNWRYEVGTIQAVAWLEVFELAREDMSVKACRKCSGYFVPVPANAFYCTSCRKSATRQAMYYRRKRGSLTAEQLAEEREKRREYMRNYRRKKRQRKK